MKPATLSLLSAGLLTALAGCGRAGATGTDIVLDRPEATLERPFQQVSNVVELGDGRVALADLRERTFVFADFKSGELTPIGQHADTIAPGDPAPGRHKLPGYVLRLASDTIGLVDFAAERTTLWNERGEYLGPAGGRGIGGYNQALAYDNRGYAYKEDLRSVLGGLEPGQQVDLDSVDVLRISLQSGAADTIARLKLPAWAPGRFGEQTKMVSTIFAGRDLFGVLPDGSVWVARASDNTVDWRSPDGGWSRGEPRAYSKIPVPQQEKDAFLERLRGQMSQMGAPAGIELSYPFADEKPPFSTAVTNPAGEIWLQRSRAWGDSVAVWDVVGREGRQIRTVRLPQGAVLAGFGREGRVYLILRDGENRQQLARYSIR